ncbi:MAG: DUF6328 family protein [Actinomycetes bacterium]
MAADKQGPQPRGEVGRNPVSGRFETEEERLDRNYHELLQELRVAQTGTQILFAFLLTVSFSPLLKAADDFAHRLLAVAILACAGATGLIIAPVAFHRLVFHRGLKSTLVTVASRLAQAGLALLLVALLATCLLALDAVLSRGWALVLTGITSLWFIGFWYLLPLTVRRRHGADTPPDERPDSVR